MHRLKNELLAWLVKMRWARIVGNGLAAFFTVMVATTASGAPTNEALTASVLGACIQGGLAMAQEFKRENEETPAPKNKGRKGQILLPNGILLLF